jgi:hypothetical protein
MPRVSHLSRVMRATLVKDMQGLLAQTLFPADGRAVQAEGPAYCLARTVFTISA